MEDAPLRSRRSVEDRILEATLELVARRGVAGTSIASVARDAGCGRATVYRLFPGGKAELLQAVGRREVSRLARLVTERLDRAATLDDALIGAVHESARYLASHAALRFILSFEPGVVLPYLGFGRVDRLYRAAAALLAPQLVRFVGPDRADWAVEWVARTVVSYVLTPDERIDLTDEADVGDLVMSYLAPALAPVPAGPSPESAISTVPLTSRS